MELRLVRAALMLLGWFVVVIFLLYLGSAYGTEEATNN